MTRSVRVSQVVPNVPFMVAWSGEEKSRPKVVYGPGGRGVAYANEEPGDRDSRGVLWRREKVAYGRGRPLFARLHTGRQRYAMERLLCNVCAQPADRDGDGVLWMLVNDRDDSGGWGQWPTGAGVTEPPICRGCAEVAKRLCPELRRQGHVLVRVSDMPIAGVNGTVYRPGADRPVPVTNQLLPYAADLRWVVAAHLVRELRDPLIVD